MARKMAPNSIATKTYGGSGLRESPHSNAKTPPGNLESAYTSGQSSAGHTENVTRFRRSIAALRCYIQGW